MALKLLIKKKSLNPGEPLVQVNYIFSSTSTVGNTLGVSLWLVPLLVTWPNFSQANKYIFTCLHTSIQYTTPTPGLFDVTVLSTTKTRLSPLTCSLSLFQARHLWSPIITQTTTTTPFFSLCPWSRFLRLFALLTPLSFTLVKLLQRVRASLVLLRIRALQIHHHSPLSS